MRKKKKSLYFIITILVLCLGIGYAYLTTTLSINGVTDVDSNNWDVYFDNVNVTEGSVSGEQEIEAPTITSDTTVEFHVRLKEPGDFYEFTIDAKNDGTIDAMISSISRKLNNVEITTLPAYFNYSVTYEDGNEILNDHLLAHESLETYKVRVEYRTDIDPNDLPSTALSMSVSFGVEYVQADSFASEPSAIYTYGTRRTYVKIGEPILYPNIVFYSINSTIASSGEQMFHKHYLTNNIVSETYLGYVIQNKVYYLKTYNESTSEFDSSHYYNENKIILNESFGENNCETVIEDEIEEYICKLNKNFSATISKNGDVYIKGTDCAYCMTDSNGLSECADNSCV